VPQYLYKLRRDGQEVVLTPGTWVVGRTPNAGVYVPDAMVSRRHALIRVARNHLDVLDLGSRNGTFLNGQLVRGARGLFPGDKLRFGSLEYEVEGHPVAADDPYYSDDQETPLPTRLIRSEIADRAKRPLPSDDVGEHTFVGRPPSRPEIHLEPPTAELLQPGKQAPQVTRPMPVMQMPAAPAPRVVLALADGAWADQIQRAAAIHQNLVVEKVTTGDVTAAAERTGSGLLLLDLDAVGDGAPALVKAWRAGPEARHRAVLVSSGLADAQGMLEARKLGAQAFVRAGKAAILVVAQIRFHIQLSGMLGDQIAGT